MSAVAAAPLRLVAFGDLEGSVWGAAMDGAEPTIVFGAGAASESAAGADHVALAAEGDHWHLSGSEFDLLVSPYEPAANADSAVRAVSPETDLQPGSGSGGDELCAITGTITVAGAEQAIDCLGTRSTDPDFDRSGLDSLRSVAGWFGPDRGLTLRALRPQRARGQEADRITATVFDPDGPIAVDEPRLSTTFASDGRPARTSLELWITVGEEQYPRRAAGEALGSGGTAQGNLVSFEVIPLRCHASGLDGAGVYLLARF
jgi:hypothetical protein